MEFASADTSAKPAPEHSHGGALKLAGYDLEKILNYTMLATAVVAASVVVAPLLLPKLGVGEEIEKKLIKECCKNIPAHSGLANALSEAIEKIPVVGTYLNTADGKNVFAPVGVMLGSYAAGSLVEKMEKSHGHKGVVGAAIRMTGMALGAVLALPALLPGIAHGVLFLGRLAGMENLPPLIAKDLGTNECAVLGPENYVPEGKTLPDYAFASVSGAKGAGTLLAGHAMCFVPAMVSLLAPAAGAGISKADRLMAERQGTLASGQQK